MGAVINAGVFCKCPPSTANVEEGFTLLESYLLAYNAQLVVLQLLESLFFVDVRDYSGCVDHTRTEEPPIEVITTIVVVADLFLVWISD